MKIYIENYLTDFPDSMRCKCMQAILLLMAAFFINIERLITVKTSLA